MDGQLRELIPFLRDRNPQVRNLALKNLLPQTPAGSPHRDIFLSGLQAGGLQKPKENEVIRDLKVLCRDQAAVAQNAFLALVNLSDAPLLVASLSELPFLTFIVAYIINAPSVLADLAAMLLSNLTASSAACSSVLSLKVELIPIGGDPATFYAPQSRCATSPAPEPFPSGEPKSVLALPLLLDAFIQGAQSAAIEDVSKRHRKGTLHFLANVFANLTVSPAGRTFFLTPYPKNIFVGGNFEYPLAKVVPFTEHVDIMRRRGVADTIKNCSFHVAGHRALMSPDSVNVAVPPSTLEAPGIDVIPYLLLPLAGPEEFDLEDQEKLPEALQFLPPTKTREPDSVIRLTHVETLLLLAHTRWGRDYQRDHGVYEIVRATHENETVDKISEHIERLVTLLKGDEPKVAELDEGDVEIDQVKEKAVEVSDDEDDKIEEV